MSPEVAMRSPRYLRLKSEIDPNGGDLAPLKKIEVGLEELQKLTDAVLNNDSEAYYIAVQAGQWTLENARFCYASSAAYQDVHRQVSEKMEMIHASFAARLPR